MIEPEGMTHEPNGMVNKPEGFEKLWFHFNLPMPSVV